MANGTVKALRGAQAKASEPANFGFRETVAVRVVTDTGKVFALYNQPPKQQPMIALLGNDADPAQARIIVDPNTMNHKGTTAIDWFVPSPDGTKLAVSLSDNGSEDGTLRLWRLP